MKKLIVDNEEYIVLEINKDTELCFILKPKHPGFELVNFYFGSINEDEENIEMIRYGLELA